MAFIYEAAAMSLTSCSIGRVAILNNLLFHVYSGCVYILSWLNFTCPRKVMSDYISGENLNH
jgi:hypothetical protein